MNWKCSSDFPTTQTIASKFVADEVDLILAIATPSAQSAANATKDIPIMITAVTDPVEAGLVKSQENPIQCNWHNRHESNKRPTRASKENTAKC